MDASRRLSLFLRISGTVSGLALLAVFMPLDWMKLTHRWLGLGGFPEGVIVEYLARSLSAFYAILGALMWFVSRDVNRYASLIVFTGGIGIVSGVLLLLLDLHLGLPVAWVSGEGPMVVFIGGIVSVLASKVRQSTPGI